MVQLTEIADIIRCQLGRSRTRTKGLICREITSHAIDPDTGFIDGKVGSPVWMDLNPTTKQSKYLIKSGDIVIAVRGTEATLCRVGLVLEMDGPAVAGPSMVVIRPKEVSGIWLFYYLARPGIRETLLARTTGTRLLNLNSSAVGALEVPVPSARTIEAVHVQHAEIVRLNREMKTARATLNEALADMEAGLEAALDQA